ncbi:MAG: hypothetical protein OXI43_13515 [Candidatus Poribacteria bacterium]|nr:hypothetical protein [Candidatus Poribacteria bacterium]
MNKRLSQLIVVITIIAASALLAVVLRDYFSVKQMEKDYEKSQAHSSKQTTPTDKPPLPISKPTENEDPSPEDLHDEVVVTKTVPDTSITEDQQRELDLIIDDYKSKISTMSHRREKYDLWSSMRSDAYQEMQEAQKLLHEKDFIGTDVDQFFKYINSLTEQEKDEFHQEYAKNLNAYKYAYTKFEMLSTLNPLAKENSNEK